MPINGELQTFFAKKNTEGLKTALIELPPSRKGYAFENVLAELYRGNGWIVTVQGSRGDDGADILLSHPKTPHTVSLIIQAKNHNKPLTLDQTRNELIKFEQQAAPRYKCQQFRLVSVNGFVGEAEKLRAFNLLLDSWEHVEKLIQHYNPKKNTLPDIELFSHNQQTYDELQKLWLENNQVAVVQATGTGKSFLIAKVMSDFHGKHKIVLAPSHYILDQQKSIAPWLNDRTTYWTYAGLARKAERDINELKTRLIVLDEFHRCGADVWGKGVQRLLDTHSDAKVLGSSATPIRYLDERRDMAEELFDGILAVDLSLAEAIVKRILPAPIYISALYTLDEEIKDLLEEVAACKRPDDEKAKVLEEITAVQVDWEKTAGVPEILKKHLPIGINKLIIFCKDQTHLDQMEVEVQKWFQKAGTHKFREKYRVLSADPASKKNLNRFKDADRKDTVHLLFAIDMLNEGLHIPEVGAVILLRPTESPTIFYQQIGRCIEVGKDHSPIIFDLVNNFQNVRAADFLDDLKDAAKAEDQRRADVGLYSNAPSIHIEELSRSIEEIFESIRERLVTWEVQYDALCAFNVKYGHCNVPQKCLEFPTLGTWIGNQRRAWKTSRLSEDRRRRLETIGFVWDTKESAWNEMCDALHDFWKKHGHCNVPREYPDKPYLGIWIHVQRNRWKKGILSEDRIKKLREIGFVVDYQSAVWEEMFATLRIFKEKHGHCNVPNQFSDNPSLGTWVSHQRANKMKGHLSEDRTRQLERIGFAWDVNDAVWEKMFVDLRAFKDRHEHCNVPHGYDTKPSLAIWIRNQRQARKRKRLSEDRIHRLDELGLTWEPNDALWEDNYKALCAFKKKHGHCYVPKRYLDNPILGVWAGAQRYRRRKNNLSKDRIRRLEELGFIWDSKDAFWEEMFETLRMFKKIHGHCDVPQRYLDNPSLGIWVSNQRHAWKAGRVSEERIRRIEELGLIREPHDAVWEDMFFALRMFKKKERHCNVPQGYVDNPSLGAWVSNQRQAWRKGRLPDDQIMRLTELGLMRDPKAAYWEEMIIALHAFKEKHGHCNVPEGYSENSSLWIWVQNQRQAWKKGQLSKDRMQRLQVLGLVKDPLSSAWEKNYADLCEFKKIQGHCNVPQKSTEDPSLSSWVSEQRKAWKKGRLSEDRIRKLDRLGFIQDLLSAAWEEMFETLCAFKDKFGYCNIPKSSVDDSSLASWLSNQRNAWKKGRLSEERIRRLEKLGVIKNHIDAAWEEKVDALRAFKEKRGHCNVPHRYHDNPSLVLQQVNYET